MTTIHIIAIGKDKDAWMSDGIAHYTKLLSRWSKVEWILLTPRRTSNVDSKSIRRAEAEMILPKLVNHPIIALSDNGKSLDTPAFAKSLAAWQTNGGGRFTFIVGGPYGLDSSVVGAADAVVSLSPLTFSHQIVRLVLLEQLYRGFSILHNTDYHK